MILLAAMLAFVIVACGKTTVVHRENGNDDKVVMVPATRPSEPEETTPVYVRPDDDDEYEDDGETGGTSTVPSNPNDEDNGGQEPDVTPTPDGGTDNDTGDGFGDTVVTNPQTNATALSWEGINSFAIKNSSMTTEQLRTLCVDFFRYAKSALWTPSDSINFIKNAKGSADTMTAGQLYGGLPYVGNASGNIYRLLDYMNEDGVVDMGDMLGSLNGVLSRDALKYFGNQCAHGATIGWVRVINSTTKFYTAAMTRDNGYIPIGPYTYNEEKIKTFSDKDGYRTSDIVKQNGQQKMFKSYALLKKADGLVYYTTAGHVIMVATDAHVEYIPGTTIIDGTNSYITMIDMAQTWETCTAADGSVYQVKNSVDAKVTFLQLYNGNYLPFTFAEFLGTDPIEETTVSFSITGETTTLSNLFKAKVTSNYSITDAYIIVTDHLGNEVYKHAVRNSSAWGKTLSMAKSGSNVDTWGNQNLESGSYTVTVVAQLGTGERPVVYTGTITV